VCDSADDFGVTHLLGGKSPFAASRAISRPRWSGQCPAPGQAKITYGTGGFMLMNTGETLTRSRAC
jgi:glycerol kinase